MICGRWACCGPQPLLADCRVLPSSCLGTDIILRLPAKHLSCVLRELLSWGCGDSSYCFLTEDGPINRLEWDQVCDPKQLPQPVNSVPSRDSSPPTCRAELHTKLREGLVSQMRVQ